MLSASPNVPGKTADTMASLAKAKEEGTTDYIRVDMPDFQGAKAFVLPGAFYGACVALMAEAGCSRAQSVEDADIVVFIGGEDINPALYNEKPDKRTSFSARRDASEISAYVKARKLRKVMFGICRGAQFLHAMNGGKLWQDVNNHAGSDHMIVDIETDERVKVTSLHHQMLRVSDDINIVAVCEKQVATSFRSQNLEVTVNNKNSEFPEIEIEAGVYEGSKCFFVQGHPEIGSDWYRSWTMWKLKDYYDEWRASRPSCETEKGSDLVAKSVLEVIG